MSLWNSSPTLGLNRSLTYSLTIPWFQPFHAPASCCVHAPTLFFNHWWGNDLLLLVLVLSRFSSNSVFFFLGTNYIFVPEKKKKKFNGGISLCPKSIPMKLFLFRDRNIKLNALNFHTWLSCNKQCFRDVGDHFSLRPEAEPQVCCCCCCCGNPLWTPTDSSRVAQEGRSSLFVF